jgi:hypothetical protein
MPSKLYMHAILAWIYFGKFIQMYWQVKSDVLGFILYMISRESVYFISLRQAYIVSPLYANRLSSRTVLFTCVPSQILDTRKLRRVFGDSVKNMWIPQDTEDLDQLVKEREQTAARLEKAEIVLIRKSNEAYQKAIKNGYQPPPPGEQPQSSEESNDVEFYVTDREGEPKPKDSLSSPSISPLNANSPRRARSMQDSVKTDGAILQPPDDESGPAFDLNGSRAARWIPYSERPVHRPIANYGRRVDTIKWTRNRLKKLGPEIAKLRSRYRKGKGALIPAVFIEFHTQVDAQSAYQTLAHHRANHMRPEITGVRPEEINWDSLSMSWWERIARRFMIQAFVAVMVIFFSLPAAFVGMISNVKSLTGKLTFLGWINKLPSVVLGLISGLLPAVALALLMALVPIILRGESLRLLAHHSTNVFQHVQDKRVLQRNLRSSYLFRTHISSSKLYKYSSSLQLHLLHRQQLSTLSRIHSPLGSCCQRVYPRRQTSTSLTSFFRGLQ